MICLQLLLAESSLLSDQMQWSFLARVGMLLDLLVEMLKTCGELLY